ncbi:hypothetical protein BJV77DRAFT_234454 [Russula vinacea]|nr:hypothetical protein BJV77DRAFT_234454 [Russula vinacea]
MDVDCLDSTPTTSKGGSVVYEVRESVHPRRRSHHKAYRRRRPMGQRVQAMAKIPIMAYPQSFPPVFLRGSDDSDLYKHFMLFFTLSSTHLCQPSFPSELLYAMRVKTARRLSKLGPAVSRHVFEVVHNISKETRHFFRRDGRRSRLKDRLVLHYNPRGLMSSEIQASLFKTLTIISRRFTFGFAGAPTDAVYTPHETRLILYVTLLNYEWPLESAIARSAHCNRRLRVNC